MKSKLQIIAGAAEVLEDVTRKHPYAHDYIPILCMALTVAALISAKNGADDAEKAVKGMLGEMFKDHKFKDHKHGSTEAAT